MEDGASEVEPTELVVLGSTDEPVLLDVEDTGDTVVVSVVTSGTAVIVVETVVWVLSKAERVSTLSVISIVQNGRSEYLAYHSLICVSSCNGRAGGPLTGTRTRETSRH